VNEDRIEKDINAIGGKINTLRTEHEVCKMEKNKDVASLKEKILVVETTQKSMTEEIKSLSSTINKAFGAIAVIIIVVQIVMPIVMKKFLGS
jgi:hypothetical protein